MLEIPEKLGIFKEFFGGHFLSLSQGIRGRGVGGGTCQFLEGNFSHLSGWDLPLALFYFLFRAECQDFHFLLQDHPVSEGYQKGSLKGSLKGFRRGPRLTPSKTLQKPFRDTSETSSSDFEFI